MAEDMDIGFDVSAQMTIEKISDALDRLADAQEQQAQALAYIAAALCKQAGIDLEGDDHHKKHR